MMSREYKKIRHVERFANKLLIPIQPLKRLLFYLPRPKRKQHSENEFRS